MAALSWTSINARSDTHYQREKLQLMSSVDKVEHPHPKSAVLIASHLLSLSFDSRVLKKAGRSLRITCNLEFHAPFLQWEAIT